MNFEQITIFSELSTTVERLQSLAIPTQSIRRYWNDGLTCLPKMTSFRVVLVCSCILTLKSFIGESLLTEYWTSPKPPINLYQDDNPPFYHGVSSGDPLPDSIILWTRATPRTQVEIDDGLDVEWRIWDLVNSTETAPELTGIARATEERDWTVKVDVRPLAHTNRTYFYKFYVDSGANSSRLGRTRTAPDPEADGGILTFAVTSCTQHQQYISGLAHMAYNMTLGGEVDPSLQSWTDENLDKTEAINAFIHLGVSFRRCTSGCLP